MQTATAAPVAVAVPDRVQQTHHAALVVLWSEAQDIANESLSAAQAAWDAERAEAEKLRVELSIAFESQASELEALQARLAELEMKAADDVAAELDAERKRHASTTAKLEATLTELATVRAKAEAERETHAEQRKRMAEEAHRTAERLTRTHTERDEARKEAGTAQAAVANLRGQIEAMNGRMAKQEAEMKRLQAELDTTRTRILELTTETGKANGQLEALRAQIAGQQALIKDFSTSRARSGKTDPIR
jgi:chromosome segregation ATPase